jgi:broad specificity phosphatase PhoE
MSVSLVYETHSTTVDNETGIATGWLPGSLSPAGEANARELGARRRDDGILCVYTSDLRRAVQTARLAFDGVLPIRVDQRLRECNYGSLNGAPTGSLDRPAHIDEPFPGGQSYREVVAATRTFLRDLAAWHDGARVLVVAHSANRWALDHLLLGRDLAELIAAPFGWQPGWEYLLPPHDPP